VTYAFIDHCKEFGGGGWHGVEVELTPGSRRGGLLIWPPAGAWFRDFSERDDLCGHAALPL
jgi:hypothetical protein